MSYVQALSNNVIFVQNTFQIKVCGFEKCWFVKIIQSSRFLLELERSPVDMTRLTEKNAGVYAMCLYRCSYLKCENCSF